MYEEAQIYQLNVSQRGKDLLEELQRSLPGPLDGSFNFSCCKRPYLRTEEEVKCAKWPDKKMKCKVCVSKVSFTDGDGKQMYTTRMPTSKEWEGEYSYNSYGGANRRENFANGRDLITYIRKLRWQRWVDAYKWALQDTDLDRIDPDVLIVYSQAYGKGQTNVNFFPTKEYKAAVDRLFVLSNLYKQLLYPTYSKEYQTGLDWSETYKYNIIQNILDVMDIQNDGCHGNHNSSPWRTDAPYCGAPSDFPFGDDEIKYLENEELLADFTAVQTHLELQFRRQTQRALSIVVQHMRSAGTELML